MRFYKVLPDLSRSRHMKIWHKALRSQWSAADIDWHKPRRIAKAGLVDRLGRVLTPVLMGEQSALYSVTSLIPILGRQDEVESQLYLTTWAVDEGRHTELFTRFYHRLDREPMSIRQFPSGFLFQSKIMSLDVIKWLSGVLISETMAKLVAQAFRDLDLDPVLSDICEGILIDEARHLGFNHIYIEDKISALAVEGNDEVDAEAERLHRQLQGVFEAVLPVVDALRDDLIAIGIDPDRLVHDLDVEARHRLQKSIDAGRRVAAGRVSASDPREAAEIGA